MGVLGNTEGKSVTKFVIAQLENHPGYYEILMVYGNDEDFDAIRTPFCDASRFTKDQINKTLKLCNKNNIPVYTCMISHNKKVMRQEEAFAKILNATEPWEDENMAKNIKVDMVNLNEEERAQLMALVEKANTPRIKPDTRWKPKAGEEYYFVYSDGSIGESFDLRIALHSEDRISIGNCFKTVEEARFVRKYLEVLHELRRFANTTNGGLDAPFFLYCDPCYPNTVQIGSTSAYTGELRFKTKDDAKAAIEAVGEDRIKKYYFRMEG